MHYPRHVLLAVATQPRRTVHTSEFASIVELIAVSKQVVSSTVALRCVVLASIVVILTVVGLLEVVVVVKCCHYRSDNNNHEMADLDRSRGLPFF